MKRKVITCDICGKDITDSDERYKFKEYKNSYANFDDFDFTKWTKLDMCSECYFSLLVFASKKGKVKEECKNTNLKTSNCMKRTTIII